MKQLIKNKIKLFLIKKSPIIILVVLFFVIIIGIGEMISKIPFVGGGLKDAELEEMKKEIGEKIGVINYDKVKKYIQMEEESHPENRNAKILVYEETRNNKESQFLEPSNIDSYNSTENTILKIGDMTKQYRLWWQFLGGIDVITTTSTKINDTSVIDAVNKNLSPIFEYTFDINNTNDFTYYQTEYSSEYTVTKIYENGSHKKTERKQKNITKKVPLPYIKKVSTMFEDINFDYDKITIEKSDWNLVDNYTKKRHKYKKSNNGSYVRVNGRYVKRNSSNKTKQQGEKLVSRDRYRKVEVREEISKYVRTKTEGYNIRRKSEKNTRYDEFMANHNLGEKLIEEDKEIILHTSALFPESYEFAYNANKYLGHNSKLLVNGGYEGTGEYKVLDMETKFILPIKFDENVNEKKINISCPFGPGTLTMNGVTKYRFHHGMDFPVKTGTPIIASAKGKIEDTGYGGVEGNFVIIKHDDGFITKYYHLNMIMCTEKQEVDEGDIIGLSGSTGYSTGPHLHFGVVNPGGEYEDPMIYLPLVKDDDD
ncbi:hypothetical protein SH1V18_47860 [Vallitalea longa]|uniref:M23ase beta-sheet core domain-containing protein n=1 Tax=Vallitalea longa TaxID=2936439 RepID=A0A9W5YGC2_9FIRM|nr:M23 family metallopeptidase [Vallitalea longa]GKX32306.1 hypothetical protein SH1V18_47860 [Vallitalea longa]